MVRSTLVTDGTSDVVLVPILQWLMRQVTPEEFEIRWADPRAFRQRTHNLADKLVAVGRDSDVFFPPTAEDIKMEVELIMPGATAGNGNVGEELELQARQVIIQHADVVNVYTTPEKA